MDVVIANMNSDDWLVLCVKYPFFDKFSIILFSPKNQQAFSRRAHDCNAYGPSKKKLEHAVDVSNVAAWQWDL